MQIEEIYKIADEIAPRFLSDEACQKYGYYDNSGILVNIGEEIKGIVFSLDFSLAAIDKAIEVGANLLITHHPAIYGGVGETIDYKSSLGNKLIRCIKNGISVISMHLNLDFAEEGIDESLAEEIFYASRQTKGAGTSLTCYSDEKAEKMHSLSSGAYGRVYEIEKMPLNGLVDVLKKAFNSDRVLFYGDGGNVIDKVASFCGAGADENTVLFAKEKGAKVIISSDFKHHILALARENGLSVIQLTHYASEQYGFEKFYKKICQRVEIPCEYHVDDLF